MADRDVWCFPGKAFVSFLRNWRRFPPPSETLWRVSAAYEDWNTLSEEIWKLHLMVILLRARELGLLLTRGIEIWPKQLLAI